MKITRQLLNGKIHRARVTGADLNYVGSITIDSVLMDAANIVPFELTHVLNLNNGNRIQTYAIKGQPNSGIIQLNGAAAHLFSVDDLVIILSYIQVEDLQQQANWKPSIVHVDKHNQILRDDIKDPISLLELNAS